MADFVFSAMDTHEDASGKPVAWSAMWAATNFNTTGPNIPSCGELLGKVRKAGARTMLIDGLTIYYAGALPGVTVAPRLYGSPTNASRAYLEKKTTLSTTDALQWECYGFPMSVTEMLQKSSIGILDIAGYAATDDMTLTMWGRFE